MPFTESDILALAQLAKLTVENHSNKSTVEDLNNILSLANQITQCDTEGVQPLAHPFEMSLKCRSDLVTQTGQHRARMQRLAPRLEAGLYIVPQVIE